MPSKHNKPDECLTADCLAAYDLFVKRIRTCFSDMANDECWNLGERRVTGMTGDQFKVPYRSADGVTKYFKPKAWRVWFYGAADTIILAEDHENFTCSHLCHNDRCLNPAHLVLESLSENKSRNTCVGPPNCNHVPQCMRRGHQLMNPTQFVVIVDDRPVKKTRER
jgi:hypothetical protein